MAGVFNGFLWLIVWSIIIIGSFGGGLLLFIPYLFFVFVGAQSREEKADANLKSVLMGTEKMFAKAFQKRIFSLWTRRSMVAITNSRLIVLNRGVLGGFKMKDIQWKDLHDAKLKQNILSGMCGSNINFEHLNEAVGELHVKGIPNSEASEIYSKAQAEEQAWEEKRRIREIEDVRAASGGTVIHTGATNQSSEQAGRGENILKQIEDAKKLLDQGVISDAEFQEMKAKILS